MLPKFFRLEALTSLLVLSLLTPEELRAIARDHPYLDQSSPLSMPWQGVGRDGYEKHSEWGSLGRHLMGKC